MRSMDDAQQRTDVFLAEDMPEALRAVEVKPPPYAERAEANAIAEMASARIVLRFVHGACDAQYRVSAYDDTLTLYVQLNVYRLVVVYRVPAGTDLEVAALELRFARWQTGATLAGWKIGWRDTIDPFEKTQRYIEVYAYAMLPEDFLWNEPHQLYWRNDVVQMTRAFMIEAQRFGVRLSLPAAEPVKEAGV
jgi:hypothetical protein